MHVMETKGRYCKRIQLCKKEPLKQNTNFNVSAVVKDHFLLFKGQVDWQLATHIKANNEWDENGFIYLTCAYCGSIMKMNIRFIEKENYKP